MIPLERHKELRTKASKVIYICDVINLLGLTPKKFFLAFLQQSSIELASRRRLWSVSGWDSTQVLLKAIGKLVCSDTDGQPLWNQFILSQVRSSIFILACRTMDFPD
jgi:hypothetical protein